MKQNTAFPDLRFDSICVIFKLSDDIVIFGSEADKIFFVDTRTNKLVSTVDLPPQK
jgi:hypothetical protein